MKTHRIIPPADAWRHRLTGHMEGKMTAAVGDLRGLSPRQAYDKLMASNAETGMKNALAEALEEAADRAGLVEDPPWVPVRNRGEVTRVQAMTGEPLYRKITGFGDHADAD